MEWCQVRIRCRQRLEADLRAALVSRNCPPNNCSRVIARQMQTVCLCALWQRIARFRRAETQRERRRRATRDSRLEWFWT